MASVRLHDVRESDGPLDVVENVFIDVMDGEFVVPIAAGVILVEPAGS